MFNLDGDVIHPVTQEMADALEVVMTREGTDNHLEAITRVFERYNSDLWTFPDLTAEVYLQGEPGFENLRCSAADLGEYEIPHGDVAEEVDATRALLIETAVSCDYPGLIELTESEGPLDQFWWGAGASIDTLRIEDRSGALRQLVFTLLFAEPVLIDLPPGGDGQSHYLWPAIATAAELQSVAEDDLRMVAGINEMTVEDFTEAWDVFGGYGLFRVGVAEDGTWLFALSGD